LSFEALFRAAVSAAAAGASTFRDTLALRAPARGIADLDVVVHR
jgi:hypothetical protein